MKNIAKITIIIILLSLFGFGFSAPVKNALSAQCYYPFQRIDLEEIYNGSVCQGYFQVYYFPVVSDGRQYTITLHTINGEQKLYASRYKDEVDELSDLMSWACNDDHCDSSTQYNADTRIVTFRSPSGEDGYYSWFAVYGNVGGNYQIGVSNNGTLQFLTSGTFTPAAPNYSNTSSANTQPAQSSSEIPSIAWKTMAPENVFNSDDTGWTSAGYNDGAWQETHLPDWRWYCDNCYKKYRGTFELSSTVSGLKLTFASDDGLWLYANGQFLGHWGADSKTNLMCVNYDGCANNQKVADIPLANLVSGKNIISAVIYNGGGGQYFNLQISK
jgi:hypothetical protein